MNSNLFCNIHNKRRVHNFCSADKCENVFLCHTCIVNHIKKHEPKFIEQEDFNESYLLEKIGKIFSSIKCEDDKNFKIHEMLIEQIEKIESICISYFKEIKDEINNVMSLINNDARKSIIVKIQENYKDFTLNENISKEQNLKKIFDQINDCEANVERINDERFFKFKSFEILEEFSSLKKNFEKKKAQIIFNLKEKIIVFDKNFKQEEEEEDIEISEDCLQATKIVYGHKTIFFTKSFSQGIHKWSLQLEAIDQNNGDWIQFGILDKADFNNSKDINSYKKPYEQNSWSIASQNLFKNYINRMTLTGECLSYNNLKFDCILNCDEGIFVIEGNGIKAEARGLSQKVLYPFVNLCDIGCVATLV